jgi:outer membrane receptor protein involved in Fe transport
MKKILIVWLFMFFNILAQNNKITGVVIDNAFGDPLIGVNVFIEGTNKGAATDINGYYYISEVPNGTYTITYSMIGFKKHSIKDLKLSDNIKLDVVLVDDTYETEEVIVEAEALTNTEASLLAKRQKSISISDAISAEEISKSGSSDASSAMKKVTGASVVGGKYVYIRGLGERYSSTMLNGAEIPSADPDKKSFQFDLIPSNMLDNINTIKTFTPDRPGTFTGGLVDITLKSYPENLSFKLSSSVGYNSIATGNNNFILGNNSNTDWLGFDSGERDLPSLLSSDILIPRTTTIKTKEDAYYLDNISKSFNNKMVPIKSTANPNSSFGISIGNSKQLTQNSTLGYFGSFTYGNKYSFVNGGDVGRYKLVGSFNDVTGLEAEFEGKDTKGIKTVDWGAIGNIGYKNKNIGELKFSYMRTQSAESMARYMVGVRDRDRSSASSTVTFETRVISWTERALSNYQLEGNHLLFNNIKLDWKTSYSNNTQDEPDQRYFFNIFRVNDDGSKTYAFDGANSQPISRYFRELKEDNISSQLNVTIPIDKIKLKTGIYTTNTNRVYDQKRFDYVENRIALNDYNDDISSLFDDVGIIDSLSKPDRPSRWFGLTLDNQATKDSTNYFRGKSDVFASYLMVDYPILNNLRFIGGTRLETTYINSYTLDKSDNVGKLNDVDLLPALNLIYSLSDNMNLRASYTNTIARPTFRELAPYMSFEFVGDFLYIGNSNLKRTLIENYDLRWEWFLNPGEILAVSGFYKDFSNPIESFIDPTFSDDNTLRSVKNVKEAKVYGVEFEFRKNIIDNLKLGTNISLIKSEVEVPQEELDEKIFNGEINPEKSRPFAGQSPYLFNVNLTYDNNKLYTGLFYTVFGDRLYVTGRHATPDVYERGYGTLDFKSSYKILDNLELSLAIKNILNPEKIFSYNLNNKVVNKEYKYSSYYGGREIKLEIGYNL